MRISQSVRKYTRQQYIENYSCKDICEKTSTRFDQIWCCNITTLQCAKDYVQICNPHLSLVNARTTIARNYYITTKLTPSECDKPHNGVTGTKHPLPSTSASSIFTSTLKSTPTLTMKRNHQTSLPTILSTLGIIGFDTTPKNVQISDIDGSSKYIHLMLVALTLTLVILGIVASIAAVICLRQLFQRKKTKHQNVKWVNLSKNNSISIMLNPFISSGIMPNDHIYCPPNAAPPLPKIESLDKYLDANAQLLSDYTHRNVHYEINPSDILVVKEVGKGNYGTVVKCILRNHRGSSHDIEVAGKTLKYGNLLEETCLRNELDMLLHIGQHCNIISMIGVITKPCDLGRFILINEFCQLGDLESYIKQRRSLYEIEHEHLSPIDELNSVLNGSYLCFSALLMYAFQIANGAYYYTHIKTVIHRDLALRNILLTSDHIVKIADFGLAVKAARYDVMHQKPSPIPWHAPECLHGTSAVFTTESDVWSYGVILWELFSLAGSVWNVQAPKTKKDLLEWITLGNRYEIPKYASQPIAIFMKKCWQFLPENRPSFLQCRTEIQNILFNYSETFNYISQKIDLEML